MWQFPTLKYGNKIVSFSSVPPFETSKLTYKYLLLANGDMAANTQTHISRRTAHWHTHHIEWRGEGRGDCHCKKKQNTLFIHIKGCPLITWGSKRGGGFDDYYEISQGEGCNEISHVYKNIYLFKEKLPTNTLQFVVYLELCIAIFSFTKYNQIITILENIILNISIYFGQQNTSDFRVVYNSLHHQERGG